MQRPSVKHLLGRIRQVSGGTRHRVGQVARQRDQLSRSTSLIGMLRGQLTKVGRAGMAAVERTLVLLKPDAVARGLAGRLIQRFEDAGLTIVGVRMRQMDAELARRNYFDLEELFGRSVFDVTAGFMQSGPVTALVLEGV